MQVLLKGERIQALYTFILFCQLSLSSDYPTPQLRMLSKLAKAKNAQNTSPSATQPHSSSAKRHTLEIFSQFRQADVNDYSTTSDDEIEAMLDENLFRGNLETPATTIKGFQLASDVSVMSCRIISECSPRVALLCLVCQ